MTNTSSHHRRTLLNVLIWTLLLGITTVGMVIGKDPLSIDLRASFLLLFTTIPGGLIVGAAITWSVVRRLRKSRRG